MIQQIEKQPKRRLGGIEAARGVAASMVVFYHAARHADAGCHAHVARKMLQFGHAGVDIFFVLSGFIILFVHAGDLGRPARLVSYLKRRFTRVLPIYWVALAATLALAAFGSHALPGLGKILWSALLLPSWSDPVLGVAWTLQYEVVFYAMFALLIVNRRIGIGALALWFTCICAATLAAYQPPIPSQVLSAYNLEFFMGMGAALWLKRDVAALPGWVLPIGILGFLLAALAENAGWLDGYNPPARMAYGVPAALIVAGLAAQNRPMPPFLVKLGAASYSIYLFQFCFIGVAWQALRALKIAPCTATIPALASCAIAGGLLVSMTLEYPLMQTIRGRKNVLF